MDKILKILLYIFSSILILNILLFLFLLATGYQKEKSFKKNINKIFTLIIMGYTFLFLGVHELIFGKQSGYSM